MNVLYVTTITPQKMSIKCGHTQIEYRNRKCIEKLQGKEIDFYYADSSRVSFLENLFLKSTPQIIKDLSEKINSGLYTHIYFSQSHYGRVVEYIKKKYSKIKIITFFHDVDIDRWMLIKRYNHTFYTLNSYLSLKMFKSIENKSCKYSDKIIVLNNRDARRIKSVYNRNVDHIIPATLDDKFESNLMVENTESDIDYLFVGANFYANIEGLQWFILNVMPYVKGKLYIVGNQMDRADLNNRGNKRIVVKGSVDDLSSYYYRAKLVISPILSGTGMKIKTAEYMMYGKTIVGTDESFEGYDTNIDNIYVCNSAESFIEVINQLDSRDCISKFNQGVRDIFLKCHTQDIALNKFKRVFE